MLACKPLPVPVEHTPPERGPEEGHQRTAAEAAYKLTGVPGSAREVVVAPAEPGPVEKEATVLVALVLVHS